MRYVVLGIVLFFAQAFIISKVFKNDFGVSLLIAFYLDLLCFIVYLTVIFW
ncbi:hypothetical protein UFOVP514_42 [uncultured Caudovirales phage]|uniref:Uncharacterized protein n=1 Tax=uncultured Caudovirales phage TaxID=2100421 RepID=A0A6J5MM59_9CAUD|nr:hypothetical protein UFOVP514_42 [uncultured Caudovirales phage]